MHETGEEIPARQIAGLRRAALRPDFRVFLCFRWRCVEEEPVFAEMRRAIHEGENMAKRYIFAGIGVLIFVSSFAAWRRPRAAIRIMAAMSFVLVVSMVAIECRRHGRQRKLREPLCAFGF